MATDPLFLLVAIFVGVGHLRLNPEEYVSLYGNLMTIFVFMWATSARWPSSKLATNTEDGHEKRQGVVGQVRRAAAGGGTGRFAAGRPTTSSGERVMVPSPPMRLSRRPREQPQS